MQARTPSLPLTYDEWLADLRAEIARRRLTGVELARRMGVTQQYISRRTTGAVEMTYTDLLRFADALGIPAPAMIVWAPWDSNPQPTGLGSDPHDIVPAPATVEPVDAPSSEGVRDERATVGERSPRSHHDHNNNVAVDRTIWPLVRLTRQKSRHGLRAVPLRAAA